MSRRDRTAGGGIVAYRVCPPGGGDINTRAALDDAGTGRPLDVARAAHELLHAPEGPAIAVLRRANGSSDANAGCCSNAARGPAPGLQGEHQVAGAEHGHAMRPVLPHAPGSRRRGRDPGQGAHARHGRSSLPWPAANEDVRYGSLCMALATGVIPTVMVLTPPGGIDAGCRFDDQVHLDASGDDAFVLGTEAQRATTSTSRTPRSCRSPRHSRPRPTS